MESKSEKKIVVDPVGAMTCARCSTQVDVSGQETFSSIFCPSCGAEQVVPARFGPFLLISLINMGGMGCVYLARDESLGRLVALKVMHSSLGDDATFVESFRREAQAAARLNHPNIAQMYSFGQEHGQPYIVMELIRGKRFDKLISDGPPLDPAFVLKIGIDIAEGLKAADEIGLIHGDIKPENILLDEKMNAKLVDFGIATIGAEKQAVEGVWGTPYYIAPEKVLRQKVDARSDIYCLGATLYHAFAGRPPFDGETPIDVVKARLDGCAEPLRAIRPEISPSVERLIIRMLQKDPALRHPTYASLLGDLRSALAELGPQAGALAGQRTRRVTIKRRGGGPPAGQPSGAGTDSEEEGGTAPAPERLLIRKRAVGRVTLSGRPEKSPEEMAREEKARRKRTVITLVLLLGLVLLGGGVFAGWKSTQRQQVAAAARKIQLEQERQLQAQVDRCEAAYKRMHAAAGAVMRVSPAMRPHAEGAEKMAKAMFGQSLAEMARSQEAAALQGEGEQPPPEVRMNQELGAALLRVNQDVQSLARADLFARELDAFAAEALKSAKSNTNVSNVEEHVTVLETCLAAVEPLKDEMIANVGSAEKAAKQVQELRRSIERELAASKEAAARLEKEAARKVMVEEDVARVDVMRAACKPLLDAMNFAEAARVASNHMARLKTPEAGAAARPIVERARRLQDLKAFLIESINAHPFRWGWSKGRNASEDITGADDEGIKIRTGSVPWTRINSTQFMKILEHYLEGAGLRPQVNARRYLAMALLMEERGEPAAMRACVAKALAAMPAIQKEVDLVMPPKGEASAEPETASGAGQDQGGT